MTSIERARLFHEVFERLRSQYGISPSIPPVPWADLSLKERAHLIAVFAELDGVPSLDQPNILKVQK